MGYLYLPHILTSNVQSKINNRSIQNNKFLSKISTTATYQDIKNKRVEMGNTSQKEDIVISLLSILINTVFTFVDYEHPEQTGEAIEINQDILSDEFLDFIKQI